MIKSNLRLVDVNEDNYEGFKQLVLQQAEHHLCAYKGDDAAFLAEIKDPHSSVNVMMAWSEELNCSVGYVLYNIMHTLKGKEIYIEDIIVRQGIRSMGIGSFFFDELKLMAQQHDCDAVSWVVARNNPDAVRFYTDKMAAKSVPSVGYDCVHLLQAQFNNASAGIFVRPAEQRDIDALFQVSEVNPLISNKKIGCMQRALNQPHVDMLIAHDVSGTPLGLLVANSNYSSFRTVYGYKVELMELTDNAPLVSKVFSALSECLTQLAKAKHHEGHINIFIDPNSEAQRQFIRSIDGVDFMMSAHPNSYLDVYAIDRAVINSGAKPARLCA